MWVELETGNTITNAHYEGEPGGLYDTGDTTSWYGATYATQYNTFWHWIAKQLIATMTYPTSIATGATTDAMRVVHKATNLTHQKYDIRIVRRTPNKNNYRYGDRMFLGSVREVIYDDFTYPRNILVGIKALATDKLSGSFEFRTTVEGSLVNVYNGSAWTISYSNNPAWVCYDVLTQPVINDSNNIIRYDGIDPSRLDTTSFYTWAQFCDELVNNGEGGTEKRFTFNGTFDTSLKLWEAALQIAAMSRALLVWNGIGISVIIDKAVTLPDDAVQLFTMSNILQDSFKETFLSLEDRAGEIEVSYNNQDMNYERDVLNVYSSALDRPTNKVSLSLIGCTSSSQAWRTAQFQLLQNEYVKRIIEFQANVEAVAITIGDVFYFSHDVPQWGLVSGSIKSASNSPYSFALADDKTLTIESGKTYGVMVRLNDDTIVTKTITNSAGTYNSFTVSTAWTTLPNEYDKVSIGELNTESKPFRAIEVSRDADLVCTIKAVEYDDNIYSVDTGTPILPATNYSGLTFDAIVSDLSVKELIKINESGSIDRQLAVSFTKPNTLQVKGYNVNYRKLYSIKNNEDTAMIPPFTIAGRNITTSNILLTKNIDPASVYQVYVTCVDARGVEALNLGTPLYTITTSSDKVGVNPILDNGITGLSLLDNPNGYQFSGRDCKLTWNRVTSSNDGAEAGSEGDVGAGYFSVNTLFKDYEVNIYSSNKTLLRKEYTIENYYNYTLEKNSEDCYRVLGLTIPTNQFYVEVKIRDMFNRVSSKARQLYIEHTVPSNVGTITTEPFEDGMTFKWDKLTAIDIRGYKVRTKVNSGDFGDWIEITDNIYKRELTIIEKASQGQSTSTIYIEVIAINVFNQESATATTANDECLNQKPLITVANTTGYGIYQDLQTAIDALPSGGQIFIKSGSYTISSPGITISNANYEIVGENQDTVVFNVVSDYNGINFADGYNYKCILNNFSLNYNHSSTSTTNSLIYMANCTTLSTVNLTNLKLTSNDVSHYYKYGIYSNNNFGRTEITNCSIFYGTSGIYFGAGLKSLYIATNRIDTMSTYGIYSYGNKLGDTLISGNVLTNINVDGIHLEYPYNAKVTNNDISSSTAGATFKGIYCHQMATGLVSNNSITNYKTTNFAYNALYIETGSKITIISNEINGSSSYTGSAYTVYFTGVTDSIISNNKVTLNITDTTSNHYGIALSSSDRNRISSNTIDLINNNAKDVGIYLATGSDYNYGVDNITYRVGTSLTDSGTGNSVSVTDV